MKPFKTYFISTSRKNFCYFWLIGLLVLLPLVLGALYGVMYGQFFSTGNLSALKPALSQSSGLVTLLEAAPELSPFAIMQLSVFTGITYFIVSFFVSNFIKSRALHFSHRLLSMGYENATVYWGEGLIYTAISFLVILTFNLVFSFIHKIAIWENPTSALQLLGIIAVQSLFSAGYGLMALGLFKKEKTFSIYHFYPAFVLSFLGGAMFPVDQMSSGGLYEFMPNHMLMTAYRTLYRQELLDAQNYLQMGLLLLGFALAFAVIGRIKFTLKEVG